ncbi:MAG: hypothetical protein WCE75_07435 [Terracidiphilus sp.]
MTEAAHRRTEYLALLGACAAASAAAILWSWRTGSMLNYGDAVAHLHIARRVFDCHQPRLTQLGSVWLPLQHILLLPFVQVYAWWASGWAAVAPSAAAYLLACAGLWRLARRWLGVPAAAVALAFFALNPNLLYLQTTAMTEPVFLCEMVWAAVWLVEWRASLDEETRRTGRLTWRLALVLVAAVYTRYDGWTMALVAWVAMGVALLRRGRLGSRAFWLASVVVVAAPVAWFVYNQAGFEDWLYFARGPYSAAAIEARTSVPGFPPHPGFHNPWVAEVFYLKAALLDAAALRRGAWLLALALAGTAFGWLAERRRTFGWALLLWFPAPFYAYSVSWGSVPIFLPVWWPHSWYNLRYGMEMLPAFALGAGFAARLVLGAVREFKPAWQRYALAPLLLIVAVNAARMVQEQPLVYVEGTKNIAARRGYDREIPEALRQALAGRPGATVLMNTSVFPEFVASTGIPLRQTINESDLKIWEHALDAPAQSAAVVLAFDGDDVDRAVKAHPEGLAVERRFTSATEPAGTLYLTASAPRR